MCLWNDNGRSTFKNQRITSNWGVLGMQEVALRTNEEIIRRLTNNRTNEKRITGEGLKDTRRGKEKERSSIK